MIYDQEYQCYISPYYDDETKFPGVYQTMEWTNYHPFIYVNKTSGVEEFMCVGVLNEGEYPTSSYIDEGVCE